jgi:hypothetical protein
MCIFSSPTPPAPVAPTLPTPPKSVPRPGDPEVRDARRREKKKLASQQGRKSTILTGSRGDLSEANVMKKTLLGS